MKGHIFKIQNQEEFNSTALELFRYQYANNKVYKQYVSLINKNPEKIVRVEDIPFLPVSFFKTREVATGGPYDATFESSGTTGADVSRHYVKDLSLYEESFLNAFQLFNGHPQEYCILALLPSYLERGNSSLVYMASALINRSKNSRSGFYLSNFDTLKNALAKNERNNVKTLLLGVSFALLDFAHKHPMPLNNTIVMETGGMKGRREEITREALHKILQEAFGKDSIHSEYGMTELLSQAYSKGKGVFYAPPWMNIFIRDRHDPFSLVGPGQSGGINIIDLANMHSCPFIETMDMGKLHPDGSFEVSGRFENSDIRGCNLLFEG